MPYLIKRTDGNIIATITDGTVDSSSTSLTLIGKNYKGIGEIYNENLVVLLENFANSTPPSNSIKGQLWFNSRSSKLNVYDGTNWRPVGSPFVTTAQPQNLIAGDLWIDVANQQLKFFDGSNLVTAGPIYSTNQGKNGWIVEEILASNGDTRIVVGLYANNIRMAILNSVEFIPLLQISGFTQVGDFLKAGLSFNSLILGNTINAPAESAKLLIDDVDGPLNTTKFVRSDRNSSIQGSLVLSSSEGIALGQNNNFQIYIEENNQNKTFLANNESGAPLAITLRDQSQDNEVLLFETTKLSVFPAAGALNKPDFDVNADTIIRGSLTVLGNTEFVSSNNLQISDKNIEIAVTDSPSNSTANGAGITVLGGPGNNKTITWLSSGILLPNTTTLPSWELNDNLKIPSTNSFYIGNLEVLNSTTLGDSVINSNLQSVGTLNSLDVSEFSFNNSTITVSQGNNLTITVDETQIISLTNRIRVTNVDSPVFEFDVANKIYVDQVKTSINYLTIDVTGFSNVNTEAVPQIQALIPPISVNLNDTVRVLCLSYNGSVTRTLKVFRCELVVGVKTWVYVPGEDILL
jgi:hypothetical protein